MYQLQNAQPYPLYSDVEFKCGHCNRITSATYHDIEELLNNAIICEQCHYKLKLSNTSRKLLQRRQKFTQLSCIFAILFAIPYFTFCITIAMQINVIVTITMFFMGFLFLTTLRSALIKKQDDYFLLMSLKPASSKVSTKKHKIKKKNRI